MSSSVNRPPTPDPDESDKEFSLQDKIRYQLQVSGEKEKLKRLLRERLEECGWKEDLRQRAKEYVERRGRENVSVDDIIRSVRPEGRATVPDSVKAELLNHIKTFIISISR